MLKISSSYASLLLALCAGPVVAAQTAESESLIRRNFGIELSEDEEASAALERALSAFLADARAGEFADEFVDPDHVAAHGFYFDEILGMASTERRTFQIPTVLKSYSENERDYFITVSFTGLQDKIPFTYRILELKAVPLGDSYRFYCPLEDRTRHFNTTQVGGVTYHHSGALNLDDAKEFAEFQAQLCELAGTPQAPLDYYKFETLDELLTSHGILFSATKCNFLAHDLGFIESDGSTFLTGTDDASYISGFVVDYLERHVPGAAEIFSPCATGLAIYYGGYFTTLTELPALKAQFRKALADRPDLDFLAEFKKGRGSSVGRHFSHYVICALLCEETLAQHGFDAVLRLVQSGKEGERFFDNLKAILNVDETTFHGAVLRLLDAKPSVPSPPPGK